MPNNPRHQAILARLQRVRVIERHAALAACAEAQLTYLRLSGLAARSRELAQEYAARRKPGEAHELRMVFHMRAQLGALVRDTRGMAQEADTQASAARDRFAAADRRLGLIEQRMSSCAATGVVTPVERKMARRLQSDGMRQHGRR